MITSIKMSREGVMRSVTVRLNAAEFSAEMTTIGEWLNVNRHEPTRYKYDHHEDAVLVTVDFPTEVAAEAFAVRFNGSIPHLPNPASSDSLPSGHIAPALEACDLALLVRPVATGPSTPTAVAVHG